MAVLTFIKGANQGTTMELVGDKIILGRNADCHVVLNVPAVSREHAVIRKIQGKFFIEDMKSRNGTFLNNKEVVTRTLLKDQDRIKICDNVMGFYDKKPDALFDSPDVEEEPEEDSSTVEATLSGSSKQILEAQPAEKLAMLLDISAELSTTFDREQLLPKILEHLFNVFRQADRGFIILDDDGKLIPKAVKNRRDPEGEDARFSRTLVRRCLGTGQSLLSEDASSDQKIDLSQSIAEYRIRSIMLVPLMTRQDAKAFGVIQLDTLERFKKFTQDDLKLLLAVAGQASVALENAQMHALQVARAGLERDLKLAHQVQLSFLPKKPPQVDGYEFFAHYESAQDVGGDYYDFIPMADGRLTISIGDVAGKGVPAALLMAKVSSECRFCLLTEPDPAQAIYKLNEQMQEAGLLDRFVTLEMNVLDTRTHTVTVVNAGHNPSFIYRRRTGTIEEGMDRNLAGFPLGVADGIPFESASFQLEPGDIVTLFTDGVPDARDLKEVDFKMERIPPVILDGTMTPRAVGERLVAAVKQYSLGQRAYDDMTVVVFGRLS